MERFKTLFKKPEIKTSGSLFGWGSGAYADWRVILGSVAVLSFLLTVANVLIFIKVDQGEIFVVEAPKQSGERALNLSTLRETVEYYKDKALEFERIKSGPATGLVDPSI